MVRKFETIRLRYENSCIVREALHTDKYFRNRVNPNQIWIIITLFSFRIEHLTECRLVLNLLEKSVNTIPIWFQIQHQTECCLVINLSEKTVITILIWFELTRLTSSQYRDFQLQIMRANAARRVLINMQFVE